jgi:hypothetical protein
MYYLYIPKIEDGTWFCEGRFFTLEEIVKTRDEGLHKKIVEFVFKRNIEYI